MAISRLYDASSMWSSQALSTENVLSFGSPPADIIATHLFGSLHTFYLHWMSTGVSLTLYKGFFKDSLQFQGISNGSDSCLLS